MQRFVGLALAAVAFSSPAMAHDADVAITAVAVTRDAGVSVAGDRHYAAYGQCMMVAAVNASYTPARNDEIFGLARSACAKARDRAGATTAVAMLDAADAKTAATLPELIDGLRDRRRTRDALYGTPAAPHAR